MGDGIDPEIKQKILSAAQALEKQGAKIIEIEMPSFKHALSVYYLVATAEASANLSRFDGVRFGHRAKEAEDIYTMFKKSRSQGFGPEVKRRIMLGTYALSSGYYDAYYLKAQKVRTLIKQDFAKAYQKCDVLFTPTTPTVAFKFGEKTNDPLSMYLSDIATIPINLAGVPAMAMPCGTSKGLPVGLQIIGREFDEATIFKTAFAVEKSL
jgi:aspartyl-tRNA(Asn)/glutamyl-tRNA(Gln) amidotransferase subunit A